MCQILHLILQSLLRWLGQSHVSDHNCKCQYLLQCSHIDPKCTEEEEENSFWKAFKRLGLILWTLCVENLPCFQQQKICRGNVSPLTDPNCAEFRHVFIRMTQYNYVLLFTCMATLSSTQGDDYYDWLVMATFSNGHAPKHPGKIDGFGTH